ncbi:hypothetical protein [Streptomyces sp. NPDC090080]|uniref:hypothetical protein n=1 Tax=Streptomyces sp. NPDC090080 TaxID=3365939 RepID=UPI0037F887F6
MSTSSLVQLRSTHRVDAHVSIIDGLISQPLLEESSRPGTSGRCSGPGFHVAVFHESRDFWDDRTRRSRRQPDGNWRPTSPRCRRPHGPLGAPQTVDLWPFLELDARDSDIATAEPIGFLSGVVVSMRVWRLPNSDPEWQFQLLAGMGETSSPQQAPSRCR